MPLRDSFRVFTRFSLWLSMASPTWKSEPSPGVFRAQKREILVDRSPLVLHAHGRSSSSLGREVQGARIPRPRDRRLSCQGFGGTSGATYQRLKSRPETQGPNLSSVFHPPRDH